MSYWLARKRNCQEHSYIQRFDPRFWTVNFPRPAMASVVTNGPDSLRVDVEFHHEGELAGLIWESEDTLDHPLLAYETDRDYSYTTLSFRWQSQGVIGLDAVNGPTLTIEGRNDKDEPRTWFVRLWNYASGTPEDALISLPFSQLEAGFALPGESVIPTKIDRMFVSLVPQGFVAGSTVPLTMPIQGWVVLSQVNADGGRAMLEIGDVRLPAHGERIATAYDDAYNQTPARLVRNIIGLGYRDDIAHYVGMSHYMRLERQADSSLLADPAGTLCQPCRTWHESYFAQCRESDLEVIASISYEVFNSYCPEDWKQRTWDGSPALTGWDPPSTLLSPANVQAMTWLQACAVGFVSLLETAGLPVRMQIGEPWWWTTFGTFEICLYDDAARTTFGGAPPEITDMRAPLDSAQKALLDQAGAVLAQSTAELGAAIRQAAAQDAEILLLAFTPTILDPQTPEAHRANLPVGWAMPAFDRLQLEDYDWLTDGRAAQRRNAYSFVDTRLGYPAEQQDYLSGFVLMADDADAYWAQIDRGLEEAEARCVTRRYVWALPQVARDGYTRLPSIKDDTMQSFDDVLYPFALGRNTAVAPEFSTRITVTSSGHERRNALWSDARINFDVGPGIRSESELSQLIAFFRARRGPARGFRICDPFDFSSNGMTGTPTMLDQTLGLGDGAQSDFQLVKTYGDGDEAQIRPITRPRAVTVQVSVDGVSSSNWTLLDGGIVSFTEAPAAGAEVKAGFFFDVPVRFAEDRIDVSGINFDAGEAPSIPLVELREQAQ